MHPILAIFTLIVGAAVGGFAGVYLALPIAAIIRVIWRRLGSSRDQESHVFRPWPLSGVSDRNEPES
jgi:predicted PurR-regulated permease PerM